MCTTCKYSKCFASNCPKLFQLCLGSPLFGSNFLKLASCLLELSIATVSPEQLPLVMVHVSGVISEHQKLTRSKETDYISIFILSNVIQFKEIVEQSLNKIFLKGPIEFNANNKTYPFHETLNQLVRVLCRKQC